MIIKIETGRIRQYMSDLILSVVTGNKKYISTYYRQKKYLNDPLDEQEDASSNAVYENIITFSFFSGHLYFITDIYLEKKTLKFDYTEWTEGTSHTGTIDTFPLEILYAVIKWLQRHNYPDNMAHIRYCYFCGGTQLQKLAWTDVNADNQFIGFYDEQDCNAFCDKCRRNTSFIEYGKPDVPVELINAWFGSAAISVLEDITGLIRQNFKNDSKHSMFLAACKEFWEHQNEAAKRDAWIRFRDI